jgi:hypothetical protein
VLVRDEVSGNVWSWGRNTYVRFAPDGDVAHIAVVQAE